MAGRYTAKVNILQKALIHNFNDVILLNQEQFYSKDQNRVITMFVASQKVWNEETGKLVTVQLIKTASQIDLVKFLGERYKRLTEEKKNKEEA